MHITAGRLTCVAEVVQNSSRFARSNIVLKDGKLTFATTAAENAVIPANSQGVHFRWGSLIGLSSNPNGLNNSIPYTNNDGNNIVVFMPTEYGTTKPAAWGSVPYGDDTAIPLTTTTAATAQATDNFILKYSATGYDAAGGRGDICRYISDKGWVTGRWRMPTINEINALYTETTVMTGTYNGLPVGTFSLVSNTSLGTTTTFNTGNAGHQTISSGWFLGKDLASGDNTAANAAVPKEGTVFFPASGYRYLSSGSLYNAGATAFYCSSSAYTNSGYVYYMYFTNTSITPTSNNPRTYGYPVRCVEE